MDRSGRGGSGIERSNNDVKLTGSLLDGVILAFDVVDVRLGCWVWLHDVVKYFRKAQQLQDRMEICMSWQKGQDKPSQDTAIALQTIQAAQTKSLWSTHTQIKRLCKISFSHYHIAINSKNT